MAEDGSGRHARRLTLVEVLALCELSRSTLNRRVLNGTFPPPLKLNRRGDRYWLRREVLAWIQERDNPTSGYNDDRMRELVSRMNSARSADD